MKPLHARTSDFYKTPTVRQQCCSCFFPRGLQRESRKMTELRPLPPSSTDRGGGLGESIGSGRIGSDLKRICVNYEREVTNLSRPGWSTDPFGASYPPTDLIASHLNKPHELYMQDRDRPSRIYTHVSGINVSLSIGMRKQKIYWTRKDWMTCGWSKVSPSVWDEVGKLNFITST